MKTQETYQERYSRAKARVEEIRSFYSHLFIYIIVIAGIAALNYYHNEWRFAWFLFAAGGWAIGLAAHGLAIFGANPFTNKKWEERKIKEIMEKEKNSFQS
jgi:hypothetical protein